MSLWLIIILILAVVALIIGVILASRDGGPRVTTIEHRVERDGPGEDD